jgi:hypothetical protein
MAGRFFRSYYVFPLALIATLAWLAASAGGM